MKHRKLRIAWSVAWGIVAVLLIVLWLRSYSRADMIAGYSPSTFVFGLGSRQGSLGVEWQAGATFFSVRQLKAGSFPLGTAPSVRFYYERTRRGTIAIGVPIWFPMCLLATVVSAPWVRWPNRFSVRILLLTTTLVALLLSRIVMSIR
jgi:hypothetical protein